MVQQAPPRLNELQKETVTVLLRHAITKKEAFGSTSQLADYLRRAGFTDTLLHAESKLVIFDIYLGLINNPTQSSQHPPQSTQQTIQLPSSSPTSSSSYSEPAPNPAKGILEEIEGRDDIEPLNFLPQDPFPISIYRPSYDNFDVLNSKWIAGGESYISENAVLTHRLQPKNGRIILTWRPSGRPNHLFSKTFCAVVKPDILPECHIAMGEEFGRDDREEAEEELAYKDSIRNPDMVPPEAPEPPVSRSQNLSVAGYYNHPHPEAFYFVNSSRTPTLESVDLAAYLISKVSFNMTTMNMTTMNTPTINMTTMDIPAMKRKASDPDDPDVFSEQDGNQNKRPRNFHTG